MSSNASQAVLDQLSAEMFARTKDAIAQLPGMKAAQSCSDQWMEDFCRRIGLDPAKALPLSEADEEQIRQRTFQPIIQSAVVVVVRALLEAASQDSVSFDVHALAALAHACIEDPQWMRQHGIGDSPDLAQVLAAAIAPILLESPALTAGATLQQYDHGRAHRYHWASDGTKLVIDPVP
ncbi:hypothetical protein HYV74_04085 [Candidatus Uhrbacteria bacterium]|nr:hypothetical protein [Candidatus Uhrbacteria bacterium]